MAPEDPTDRGARCAEASLGSRRASPNHLLPELTERYGFATEPWAGGEVKRMTEISAPIRAWSFPAARYGITSTFTTLVGQAVQGGCSGAARPWIPRACAKPCTTQQCTSAHSPSSPIRYHPDVDRIFHRFTQALDSYSPADTNHGIRYQACIKMRAHNGNRCAELIS